MIYKFCLGLLFCISAVVGFSQPSGQTIIPDRFKGIILYAPSIDPPANYLTSSSGILRIRGRLQSVSQGMFSQGVYRMTINQKTGAVDEVGVLLRSGYKDCDAAAVMTFFKWKFKPGTITRLDAPVIFSRDIEIKLRKAGSQ